MAFKMKGKSPMMKALIGKQHNLPPELKAKIEASPMKTGHPSKKLKDKTEYDPRVETREEVMKANALEDKNNDAAAKRAYDKMMAKKAKSKAKAKAKNTPMKKGWEDRTKKKSNAANVTNRINEGNKKGAKLTARMNKASIKGNKSKRDRIKRKRDVADMKHWNSLSAEEKQKKNREAAGRPKFEF